MEKLKNTQNTNGEPRKLGLEVEYAGLPLDRTAEIIASRFGGDIHRQNDVHYEVRDTSLGTFTLELDASVLQKLTANMEKLKATAGENLTDDVSLMIGRGINELGTKIVPYEIITPPFELNRLEELEELRKEMRMAGVVDTKERFYAAFGLHINLEVESLEADDILKLLQSYLLLAPWLRIKHRIDLTRRVTSFIDPFPKAYQSKILTHDYAPDIEQLIRDYHAHNPTRNRALDMLPLFAHIDESLVRSLYGEKEKINKRPTLHYRLPNCELANEKWSFGLEFSRFAFIEKLAENNALLEKLMKQWQAYQERWFAFESEWVENVERTMKDVS